MRRDFAFALVALAALAAAGSAGAARDLTVAISIAPGATDNSAVEVGLTAFNVGDAAAPNVTVQLFFDGAASATLHSLGSLNAGENASASENVTLGCGLRRINATVDPADQVPEGDETNNNASLTVVVPPLVNFSYTTTGVPGDINLSLDGSASHGCAPLNFTWSIGGDTRYGAAVSYTPPAGDLIVTLSVRSAANSSFANSLTRIVEIPNGAPHVTLTLPDSTIPTLTPLALAVEADDTDGQIAAYLIAFGDGNTTASLADAATYRYRSGGNFTIRVTVTDNLGGNVTSNVAVQVSNRPPVAESEFSFWLGETGTPVEFNASKSFDPEGFPLAIVWSFGDGTNASGPVVNHTYAEVGSYPVTLTVTDFAGATATERLTVRVEPPPSNDGLLLIGGLVGAGGAVLLIYYFLRRRARTGPPEKPGEGSSLLPPSA